MAFYGFYRQETLLRLVKFPVYARWKMRRSWNSCARLKTGIQIAVVTVAYDSVGVDLPEDMARVETVAGQKMMGLAQASFAEYVMPKFQI